jgi:hypothetical protein
MTRLRALVLASLSLVISACGSGSPPPPPTAPGAPTGVVAAADTRSAAVSWTAPANNGSAITGYTVTASPGGATQVAAGTSATFTGLANGTAYTFTVTATNGVGTGPASAPSAVVTTPSVPDAPTGVIAVAANAQVSLSWTAPTSTGGKPLTGYTVLVSPAAPSAVFAVTGTSAVVSGLANGTGYAFQVFATSAVGDGPPSAASSQVTPFTVPSAPAQPVAVAGDGQVSLTWAAPSSNGSAITGYVVTATPGGATLSAAGTSVTFTGLTNGSSYSFTVTALNAAGASLSSVASAAVIPASLPAAPTGVAAVPGNQTVKL